jgi:hypothetical protein
MEMKSISGIKVRKIREMTKDVGGKIQILLPRHLTHRASCGIGFTAFSIYDWHIYISTINHQHYSSLYIPKKPFYIYCAAARIYMMHEVASAARMPPHRMKTLTLLFFYAKAAWQKVKR